MEKKQRKIRQLRKDEKPPYDLLLLGDESYEALDKYVLDSEIYIIEEDNRIIAEYAFMPLNKDEVEIKNIAVRTEFQGQGMGKSLLKDATKRAKDRGFKRIIIGTGDVADILCFYQEQGFRRFGIKKNFFIENYPEAIFEQGIQLKDMVILKKEL